MLSIGIVGLPNVGKSTLFNTLTEKQVPAENYPFCTIEPNVGVVEVPDERLGQIAAISKPAKVIPAAVEFVDIAGLVKGASEGQGLGNQFLAHIRDCQAICQVVRAFANDNIVHVSGKINPEEDKDIINLELILADLATVSKRLEKLTKEAKAGDKKVIAYKDLIAKVKTHLEAEKPARDLILNEEEALSLRDLNLLTLKPIIYVLNVDDTTTAVDLKENAQVIPLNIKLENEIAALPVEEQKEYLETMGLKQSGLDKLIRAAYATLGLISFFTTGSDETRAWTVKKNTPAPLAAGVIHNDFIKGFVRAEVIDWQNFIKAGGEQRAKELGLMRIEGKDYLIQDGDICNFLINQ